MLLLPRPYPGFLPFWYTHAGSTSFDLSQTERIQLIVRQKGNVDTPEVEIKNIFLQ
jgi:hypothetical protein